MSDALVGDASIDEDGVILLALHGAFPGHGGSGLAKFRYPPQHPRYAEILAHVGALVPGEWKGVPPFPPEREP